MSSGKGVVRGTVIDSGVGTWALGPRKRGQQGGWSKGVAMFAKVVLGAYGRRLLELPFRHLLQRLPHCPYLEPAVPLVSGQVVEPDFLQEPESAVSLV